VRILRLMNSEVLGKWRWRLLLEDVSLWDDILLAMHKRRETQLDDRGGQPLGFIGRGTEPNQTELFVKFKKTELN